jgi:hypothetical protein
MAVADIEFPCKAGVVVAHPVNNTATPTDISFEAQPIMLSIALPTGTGSDIQRSCAHVV